MLLPPHHQRTQCGAELRPQQHRPHRRLGENLISTALDHNVIVNE